MWYNESTLYKDFWFPGGLSILKRNLVIDNLRGLAMLGVIGIHIGTFVLSSSTPGLGLFLLLQIFTRFAVPAFFFISGYGLFCNDALNKPLDYVASVRHHLRTVGVPYLVWSLFYIWLWQWEDMIRPDGTFSPSVLFVKLLLGEGCYHIYFLVILLGFYLTLPLWRWLVRLIDRPFRVGTAACLAVLAGLQLWLYHWNAVYWTYPSWTAQYKIILRLLNERINYIPLFYGFVFVLGGWCAIHEDAMRDWLRSHLVVTLIAFAASCAVYLHSFYGYLAQGMKLAEIPGHLTQLTPEGLLYTVCWIFFFCAVLERFADRRLLFLKVLSAYSMVIYLIHPYFLERWYTWFGWFGFSFQQVPVLLFYVLVLATSLAAGIVIHALARHSNLFGLLVLGRRP